MPTVQHPLPHDSSAYDDFPETSPVYGSEGRTAFLLNLSRMVEDRVAIESNWIGQRMTWLVISQSFLFSAFATTALHAENELLVLLKRTLVVISPLQALFAYIALCAAKRVVSELLVLRGSVDRAIRQLPLLDQWVVLGNQRTGRAIGTAFWGGIASHAIPVTIVLAWILLAGAMAIRWYHMH